MYKIKNNNSGQEYKENKLLFLLKNAIKNHKNSLLNKKNSYNNNNIEKKENGFLSLDNFLSLFNNEDNNNSFSFNLDKNGGNINILSIFFFIIKEIILFIFYMIKNSYFLFYLFVFITMKPILFIIYSFSNLFFKITKNIFYYNNDINNKNLKNNQTNNNIYENNNEERENQEKKENNYIKNKKKDDLKNDYYNKEIHNFHYLKGIFEPFDLVSNFQKYIYKKNIFPFKYKKNNNNNKIININSFEEKNNINDNYIKKKCKYCNFLLDKGYSNNNNSYLNNNDCLNCDSLYLNDSMIYYTPNVIFIKPNIFTSDLNDKKFVDELHNIKNLSYTIGQDNTQPIVFSIKRPKNEKPLYIHGVFYILISFFLFFLWNPSFLCNNELYYFSSLKNVFKNIYYMFPYLITNNIYSDIDSRRICGFLFYSKESYLNFINYYIQIYYFSNSKN